THFFRYIPANGAAPDSVEVFFRVGTDTLNYYEVAHQAMRNYDASRGLDWLQVSVNLDQLTGLKFPEDYPGGASVDTLRLGTQRVVQVSALTRNERYPDQTIRVTLRGAPSFQKVLRLFVGVRNRGTGALVQGFQPGGRSADGEIWFDNVILDEVEKSVG